MAIAICHCMESAPKLCEKTNESAIATATDTDEKVRTEEKSLYSLTFMSHPRSDNHTKGTYEKIRRGEIRLHGDVGLRSLWLILA